MIITEVLSFVWVFSPNVDIIIPSEVRKPRVAERFCIVLRRGGSLQMRLFGRKIRQNLPREVNRGGVDISRCTSSFALVDVLTACTFRVGLDARFVVGTLHLVRKPNDWRTRYADASRESADICLSGFLRYENRARRRIIPAHRWKYSLAEGILIRHSRCAQRWNNAMINYCYYVSFRFNIPPTAHKMSNYERPDIPNFPDD